jgi:hypothetical protein
MSSGWRHAYLETSFVLPIPALSIQIYLEISYDEGIFIYF